MEKCDAGVRIREEYLIIGYFRNWLVAQDKNEDLFVMDEPAHVYEIGTYCDVDAVLIPINKFSKCDYEEFIREFLGEV